MGVVRKLNLIAVNDVVVASNVISKLFLVPYSFNLLRVERSVWVTPSGDCKIPIGRRSNQMIRLTLHCAIVS